VLFGAHGPYYKKPDDGVVNDCLTWEGVSSIQMTFHEDKAPELHSMPPGGFRLAIVNCWNLETGFKVRERLAMLFRSTLQTREEPRNPKAGFEISAEL
jgi:hypothetical protein